MEAKSMNSFEDREKSFEKKFAHDEELKFKISARKINILDFGLSNPKKEKIKIKDLLNK